MPIKESVAKNIKRQRLRQGLTQAELADKSGVHLRYLSQLENAAVNATLDTLERIAVGLNVTVSELCEEDSKRKVQAPAKKELAGVKASIRLLRGYLNLAEEET